MTDPQPLRAAVETMDGQFHALLSAYDDERNRLAFYEREVNRLQGDDAAVGRADAARDRLVTQRVALYDYHNALLASVARLEAELSETLTNRDRLWCEALVAGAGDASDQQCGYMAPTKIVHAVTKRFNEARLARQSLASEAEKDSV